MYACGVVVSLCGREGFLVVGLGIGLRVEFYFKCKSSYLSLIVVAAYAASARLMTSLAVLSSPTTITIAYVIHVDLGRDQLTLIHGDLYEDFLLQACIYLKSIFLPIRCSVSSPIQVSGRAGTVLMSDGYAPGADAIPSVADSRVLLSQRDLSLLIPINFMTVPGVSLSAACFGNRVIAEGGLARCLSNLLAIGFRRFELDLSVAHPRRQELSLTEI